MLALITCKGHLIVFKGFYGKVAWGENSWLSLLLRFFRVLLRGSGSFPTEFGSNEAQAGSHSRPYLLHLTQRSGLSRSAPRLGTAACRQSPPRTLLVSAATVAVSSRFSALPRNRCPRMSPLQIRRSVQMILGGPEGVPAAASAPVKRPAWRVRQADSPDRPRAWQAARPSRPSHANGPLASSNKTRT